MPIIGPLPNQIVDGQVADAAPVMANFQWIVDEVNANVTGGGSSATEWATDSATPTYISATSFSLTGDRTDIYHVGRRLQLTQTSGFLYGTIAAASFSTVTTITFQGDNGSPIDSGLSVVAYGILDSQKPSIPAAAHSAVFVLGGNTTSLTSATLTVIGTVASGAAIETDLLGEFNTGSGVFIAQRYGWYLFNALWQPNKNAATISGLSLVQLERDGSLFALGNLVSAAASSDSPVAQCTGLIGCTPGQTLRARVIATFTGGPMQYGLFTLTIARIA